MFLNLIPHFRWIAVRLEMKRDISIIALHQIVAVLVRPYFLFLIFIYAVTLSFRSPSHAREWRT